MSFLKRILKKPWCWVGVVARGQTFCDLARPKDLDVAMIFFKKKDLFC